MSVNVTVLRNDLGLYLTGQTGGVVTLGSAPFVWTVDALPGQGQTVTSKLRAQNQYLAGDINLLLNAGSCPLVLNATGTELSFGPVAINQRIPITVNGVNAYLAADASKLPLFQRTEDSESWVVQPA